MAALTPLVRGRFVRQAERTDLWANNAETVQRDQLAALLSLASKTEVGRRYGFASLHGYADFARTVPPVDYEAIRPEVMRMVAGERDVLWPGRCRRFAQSSGTSGGKSKYIPVTSDSLRLNHFAGASDSVAAYLRLYPESRLFDGKSFILGGSFANELHPSNPRVRVGDLSANLIEAGGPLLSLFRIPRRSIALMPDWEEKLPALVKASAHAPVTNISGVPSWFLTVLRGILAHTGCSTIPEVWPRLEVFFHGGISFAPYKAQYEALCGGADIRFMSNYNASEGFFATQTSASDPSMLLLIDRGVFFEFQPLGTGLMLPIWEVQQGRTYALYITAPNGLWRYALGDTVRIESLHPLKISIAGRTKSFINAFGEELMEHNADAAITAASKATGAAVRNYTAAPVYTTDRTKGHHQWLIEWETPPASVSEFAAILDRELRAVNSDYDAKRSHSIFLSELEITVAPTGLFDKWLASAGSQKLGGQRKVPRLCPDRTIIDSILPLIPINPDKSRLILINQVKS